MSNFTWIYRRSLNVANSIVRLKKDCNFTFTKKYIYLFQYSRNLTIFYVILFSMILNLGELHVHNLKSISISRHFSIVDKIICIDRNFRMIFILLEIIEMLKGIASPFSEYVQEMENISISWFQ